MALSASTVWEVRPTNGSDNNGGGFKTGASGTDYSQQNAVQYALTGLTSSGAGAVILTASAAADMVGNIIQVISGTNFTAGFYEITSVSVGVSITVDRNCTTGAGASGVANIGGALATLGKMHTILTTSNQNVTGQIVWFKAESGLAFSASVTFTPNGGAGATASTQLNGYTTTRGDNGQVTFQATSGTSYTMVAFGSPSNLIVRNIIFDGNSRTAVSGMSVGGPGQFENCKAINCPATGISCSGGRDAKFINCICTANGQGFADGGNGANIFIDCLSYANTGHGFSVQASHLLRCISANNTGGTTDGFGGTSPISGNAAYAVFDSCLAYGNGRDGFRFSNGLVRPIVFRNNIAWGNAGKDILFVTLVPLVGALSNDYNAYATKTGYQDGPHDVVLTGDPTVAGASNNFALNNTAGAGAACRAAGFPGVFTVGGTGYKDLGPLQHQDSPATTTIVSPTFNRFIIESEVAP